MISRLTLSAFHITGRAFGIARFAALIGLMGLVAGCGGGGGGGSSGGGGPPAVTLSSVSVASATGSSTTVAAGLTLQLKATGSYSDGTTKDLSSTVTWTTSDANTATVAAGLVTGVAAGAVTITATSGTVNGTDALTVVAAPPSLSSVVISPDAPTIAVNSTQQFKLYGKYSDGSVAEITQGVTWSSSDTSVATIDPASGKATALSALGNTNISAKTASGPTSAPVQLTVTATVYAYATNFDDNTVSQYKLNSDASLSPLTGKTTVSSNGSQPFSISVEPSGEYVYVANWGSSTVGQYKIQSDGSLMGIGTVQVGLFPNSVTVNHENTYAYVASLGNNTIAQFQIGLSGQLIPLAKPTVASGTAPAAVVVDPTDHFAYVGNYGANSADPPAGPGTLSQYKIASDGSLSPIGSGSVASGQGPNALTIDHAGKFLYVANHGDGSLPGTVQQYSIGNDGSLTSVAVTNVGTRPVGIAINPSNKFLYVANYTSGSVSEFSIDATTGLLTPLTPATVLVGTNPSAVAIDPTGTALYATDRNSNKVYQFTINSTTGVLTAYATMTVDAGLHPTAIATGY